MKRNVFALLVVGFFLAGFSLSSPVSSQQPFTKTWEKELTYTNYYGLVNAISVGDINGDGNPEILLASVFNGASTAGYSARGRLVALDSSGKELWWYETDQGQIHPFIGAAIADVDGDGQADIVLDAYNIEVLNPKSSLWGDPDGTTRLTNAKKASFRTDKQPRALEVGDIDSDGKNEIFFGVQGSESQTANQWFIYCLYKGGRADKWTHKVSGPPQRIVIKDMNNDGANEVVTATANNLYLLDADGDEVWNYYSNVTLKDISVYDIDGDGNQEIIAAVGINDIVVFNKDGKPTGKKYSTVVEPTTLIVDDSNRDGSPEIYYTGMKSTLVVLDVSGNEILKLSDFRGIYVHSLFLYDINRDGKKDLIFAADNSRAGNVETTASTGTILHSTVYVYYNNFPSVAVQQVGNEKVASDYFDLAEGFLASQQYEKAREYYIKARDAYSSLGNREMVTRCDARLEEIASLQKTVTPPTTEKPKGSGFGIALFLTALCIAFLKRNMKKKM